MTNRPNPHPRITIKPPTPRVPVQVPGLETVGVDGEKVRVLVTTHETRDQISRAEVTHQRDIHNGCICRPCTTPAYGAPGYAHCAACCYGTGISEYNHHCPVYEHRELAHQQFPLERRRG